MKLFTVGYENCLIDDFSPFLRKSKISHVVDVRKNPVSRKKGFSKNKLAESLRLKEITYTHVPTLGVPREWRKLAKEKVITRKQMFSDYAQKILPKCRTELQDLLALAREKNVALLCYEATALDCHRHFVARKLSALSAEPIAILHLLPPREPGKKEFLAARGILKKT